MSRFTKPQIALIFVFLTHDTTQNNLLDLPMFAPLWQKNSLAIEHFDARKHLFRCGFSLHKIIFFFINHDCSTNNVNKSTKLQQNEYTIVLLTAVPRCQRVSPHLRKPTFTVWLMTAVSSSAKRM